MEFNRYTVEHQRGAPRMKRRRIWSKLERVQALAMVIPKVGVPRSRALE